MTGIYFLNTGIKNKTTAKIQLNNTIPHFSKKEFSLCI